jgi:hypothetical protein
VESRQRIRRKCLVCNTEEYDSLSALRKHARSCQKEPRRHAALCVAITLEKHAARVTTEAVTVTEEDEPNFEAELGVIEGKNTKSGEKLAIKTDENEGRVPNREYKVQKRKRGDNQKECKGETGDERAEQVQEKEKTAKSRHRERQSLRTKENKKRGSDGQAVTKRKSGGSKATEPGTGGMQKKANGAICKEEEFEEGEISYYEYGRGQSLEHEKRQQREEPGRRGREEACGNVEAEAKGEDAEASPERNEGKGMPRAEREKEGVPPRGDGGKNETWEAKKVKESGQEERLMALEVEAAKLGLVLGNEDTEENERVSLFTLLIARSCRSGGSGC